MNVFLSANLLVGQPYALAMKYGDEEISLVIPPSRCHSWTPQDMEEVMETYWPAINSLPFYDCGNGFRLSVEVGKVLESLEGYRVISDTPIFEVLNRAAIECNFQLPHIYDFESLLWQREIDRSLLSCDVTEPPLTPLGRVRRMSRLFLHLFPKHS